MIVNNFKSGSWKTTFGTAIAVLSRRKYLALATVLLALTVPSCATKQPPVAYHNEDNTALVIDSVDAGKSQMVLPAASGLVENKQLVDKAKALSDRYTAVVILENYSEPEIGMQFRDRSIPWFVFLRGLGYQKIIFLQGNGVANPEGLPTLVRYD